MLTGWKTVLVGLGVAIVPAATQYLGAVDWSFLGPVGGLVVGGAVTIIMRSLTSTPIFQKK